MKMRELDFFDRRGKVELLDGTVWLSEDPHNQITDLPFRFTSAQFELMTRAGLLAEDDHIELVHGELVRMSPQGDRHGLAVSDCYDALRPHWQRPRHIKTQTTHRFSDAVSFEPDLCLLRSRPGDEPDLSRIEPPALVVEVSDTTLDFDLGTKRLTYAQLGIGEYWVVDVPNRVLHVFREAVPGASDAATAWRTHLVRRPGETIAPLCFGGLDDIDVSDILG